MRSCARFSTTPGITTATTKPLPAVQHIGQIANVVTVRTAVMVIAAPVQSTEREHHTMTVAEAETTLRAQAGPFPAFGLLGLLTYDEAAKILKMTTRHVERLVSRRQLKAVALG